jgi:hypothetical protein
MTLRTWYRLHAVVTAPFALPMVLVPRWIIELLVKSNPSDLAVDLSRLVGAAYLLITFLTWAAAKRLDRADRITVARVFCAYETIGLLIGLTIHFDANGDIGRWITVGFFGVFALGYFWFGFVAPDGRPGVAPDPTAGRASTS